MATTVPAPVSAEPYSSAFEGFVTAQGGEFRLNGKPSRYGGTNNHYMIFADARAMNLSVLRARAPARHGLTGRLGRARRRRGSQGRRPLPVPGPGQGRPAYNDGPDGMQRPDRVPAKANTRPASG